MAAPATAPIDSAGLADRAWLATPDTFGRRLSEGALSAPPHIRLLGWMLYLVGIGYQRRLTIAMPPGHAKTTIASNWFPAWDLENRPRHKIILAQYEATLAEEQGKATRDLISENQHLLTVRLKQDSQAANRWRTTWDGGMWTAGSGGAISGRRSNIFIVDDPFKGMKDSHSPTQREDVWNWYRGVVRTRLFPGSAIVVIQTRWNSEDLIGHLESIPGFVHLRLPAVAEEDETIETVLGPNFVARCRRDGIWLPDWHRPAGAALWPWLIEPGDGQPGTPWFNLDELNEIRQEVGEWVWATLYQQRPQTLEGELFKSEDWQKVDAAPAALEMVRRWDLAASEGPEADFTAGVLMGRARSGKIYILDVKHARLRPAGIEQLVRATAEDDRDRYGGKLLTKIEMEPGSSGLIVENHYVTNVLPGFNVKFERSTGQKAVRAFPFAAQQSVGNVHLVRQQTPQGPRPAPWWDAFIEEAAGFPFAPHDDQVDAASAAFADLITPRKKRVRTQSSAGRRVDRWR